MTTIFTINGFMGDMWSGPQADVGRYLSNQGLNLAYWQPIGYDCGAFPLAVGRDSGLAELKNQMQLHPGPFLISSWSLGSIIATDAYKQMLAGAPGWPPLSDFKGSTAFGNPYREGGNWAPRTGVGSVPDPGGAGIGGPRNNLVGTPDWWHNYAHTGDMYACCPTDAVGDDMRIIFDFVLEQWTGALMDLLNFVERFVTGPLKSMPSLLWAVIDAITFYGGGTRQHVNYDARLMGAMNFMATQARNIT